MSGPQPVVVVIVVVVLLALEGDKGHNNTYSHGRHCCFRVVDLLLCVPEMGLPLHPQGGPCPLPLLN